MSTAKTYIGSVAARLSVEESSVKVTGDGATATIIYKGSRANLKAKAGNFSVGAAPPSDPDFAKLNFTSSAFEVASIDLTGGPGDTGRLTVTLPSPTYESSSSGGSTTNNVDWQLEWTLVERPLELHPAFASLFTSSEDIASIEKWKNLAPEQIAHKTAFEVPDSMDNPTEWTSLSALAQKFCGKLLKGISAYQVQVPVVRKTEYKTSGPSSQDGSSAGQRESPPRFHALRAAWLKTADSWAKTGLSRWEHRQEWTGFDSLDEDLYPTTTPSSTTSS